MTASDGLNRRQFLSRGALTAGGIAALGIGGPTLLTACSSSGSSTTPSHQGTPGVGSGTPRRGGTAVIATTSEIDGFYPPSNHWDATGYLYANAVYDPLVALDESGAPKPYLAESVTPNADNSVWTVKIRSGIKFSDGSPLTADVVKSNYDELIKSALTGTALNILKSVDVSGPLTVTFTMTGPNVDFPYALATQVGYMVAQSMIDASSKSSSGPLKPVGTGPFVYSEWQPNSHFTATRNPHYWRQGYPYLDSITFKPIPDTSQRESTLRTNGADLISSIDPQTVNHFKNDSGYQLLTNIGQPGEPDMNMIMLNCAVSPTNDLRVRQALAKATDQATVLKIFGGGLSKSSNGLFPEGSPYYSQTGFPTFDLAGAKKLVADYSRQHGTPEIPLTTVPDPRLTQVVQLLQQMWQQAGFKVTVHEIEQATLISNLITGNFIAYTVYQFGAPDPGLNYVWWSTTTVTKPPGIGLNFARNDDPQIEKALLDARGNPNKAQRIADYQKVNERLAVDLPYLWLGQTVWSEVANSRIQNFANLTLPDGSTGIRFDNGVCFPTEIWMAG